MANDTTTDALHQVKDWLAATRPHWIRGGFMLVYLIVLWLARLLIWLIAALQLGALLITGAPIRPLQTFCRGLANFVYDIVAFVTCVEERMPFPFSDWSPERRSGDSQ